MKIQIMNSLVIVLLIYNKQDHLEEELVLLQEVLHLIGVMIILLLKDMLEVVLNKVGLHLLILIGLIIELIIWLLIKILLPLVRMLTVMLILMFILKTIHHMHLVMHGVKLMDKMLFLILLLMLIILVMVH